METGENNFGGFLNDLTPEQKMRVIAAKLCMDYYSYTDSKNAKICWRSSDDENNTLRSRISELAKYFETGKFKVL